MLDGETHELRCKFCDFLCGYGKMGSKITCIYCSSEQSFFRTSIMGEENLYIYAAIPDDKSPYRRGLMHDRKLAIRTWLEVINKEDENEPST